MVNRKSLAIADCRLLFCLSTALGVVSLLRKLAIGNRQSPIDNGSFHDSKVPLIPIGKL
jgi:hypothetical protein